MKKAYMSQSYKSDRQGKDLSYSIGSMVGEKIMTLGGNKRKQEEESFYYQAIADIFNETIY